MAISRLLRPTHRCLRGLGGYGRSYTDGGAAPAGSKGGAAKGEAAPAGSKGGAAKGEAAPASAGSGPCFAGSVMHGKFHVTPKGGLYLTINVVKDDAAFEVAPSSSDQNEDGKMASKPASDDVSSDDQGPKQSVGGEKAFSEPVKKAVEKAVEKTVDTAVSKTLDYLFNAIGTTFGTPYIGRFFEVVYLGTKRVVENFRKKDEGDKDIEKGKEEKGKEGIKGKG